MRAWLAHDVPGADLLRSQLTEGTQIYRSCDCGCSSIGFVNIKEGSELGVSIFDIDAEIVDDTGASLGGMMLTIRSGRLHDVDVHSWFDELLFPTADQVRWHHRSTEGG
ncbi:MAG: hypothetical protein ACRBK7_10795 [Acidimicrobiales bacterium]